MTGLLSLPDIQEQTEQRTVSRQHVLEPSVKMSSYQKISEKSKVK